MALEIVPIPSTVWLFSGMHRIFMWQDVGGPVKGKISIYCPINILHKNGYVLYIMGLPGVQKVLNKSSLGVKLSNTLWPNYLFALLYCPEPSFSKCSPGTNSTSSTSIIGIACQKCRFSDPNPDLLSQNLHLHKTPGHLHLQHFWSALV